MRKVVAALFISLDGVVEAPYLWQFDVFDDDMMAAMTKQLAAQDTVLLGRVTYEDWAPYWPTSTDEPFASYINSVPKYIVSTTLKTVDWSNSTLVDGPIADTLASLKQQPGQMIGVAGSPTLVHSLLQAGLLDELMLMIHPVIAGKGKHLFEDSDTLQKLKVVDSKTTRSGVLMVTYQPRRDAE
ncbi:MAG: dihydrofolate reductase family protein [Herpetosiphonaceae bacterium]|nr:dihydrofolate reductase family protein [Herpetosiphonaceae bacterium]